MLGTPVNYDERESCKTNEIFVYLAPFAFVTIFL